MSIYKLTGREKEVIKLKKQGYSDREIATRLNLSYSTIRNYLDRARTKLQCSNTFQLLVAAEPLL